MAKPMSRRRMVTMGGAALPLVSGTTAEAAPGIPPDDPGRVFDVRRFGAKRRRDDRL